MSALRKFLFSSIFIVTSFSLIWHFIRLYFRYQRRDAKRRQERQNTRNASNAASGASSSIPSSVASSKSTPVKSAQKSNHHSALTPQKHNRTARILIHISLYNAITGVSKNNTLNQYIYTLRSRFPHLGTKNTPLVSFDSLESCTFDRNEKNLIIMRMGQEKPQRLGPVGESLDASMIVIVPDEKPLEHVTMERIIEIQSTESPKLDALLVHESRFEQLVDSLHSLLTIGTRFSSEDVAQQMNLRFTDGEAKNRVCAVLGNSETMWLEPQVRNYWL